MDVIKAKKIGFCFGVKRSINLAKESLKNKGSRPVFLLGSIVHNEEVVREIESLGGKIITSLEEAEKGSLVITKAHGVSPETLNQAREKKMEIKDTTCPIVQVAQNKAKKLYEEGYQVIIIGEKTHPEPRVIREHAGERAIITEQEEEIKNLDLNSKIGVVAQTTKKRNRVEELIRAIRKRGVEVKWEDTICNEVSDRQEELREIMKETKGVVVVGSRTSANTTRLAEIVKNGGQKLWWINSVQELVPEETKKYKKVGVVSGTSTPDWEAEKVIKFLEKI